MIDKETCSRIGLFGGTFNPIHLGHLRAAEEVLEALDLDRVIFIPSAIPPHKPADPLDPIADADQRLDWVERATAGHKRFSVDRIEMDRPGASFLIDTLEALRDREFKSRRVFIVGEDAFSEMGDWKAPKRLFTMTDFAVMTRPPSRMRGIEEFIPDVVRKDFEFSEQGRVATHLVAGTRIEMVPITALDISSSQIRKAQREGRSIRYVVPESIRGAIEKSRCYVPNNGNLLDE